ncbi:MAG: hypothetical protein ACTHJ1_15335 [Bordetella sp.]|uniref:hypothetical protein n=1 Tax=Bordetella sp. TaxID=28081 RepID=UPI003F7C5BF9
MSVSALASAANHVFAYARPPASASPRMPVASRDSDGDNDGGAAESVEKRGKPSGSVGTLIDTQA